MKNASDTNVRVVVRIRPTEEIETSINATTQTIHVDRGDRKGSTNFAFHHVLPSNSSQIDVYNACCRSNLKDVIYGKNLSVIAYGQTGSGKTFSMLGKDWEENISLSSSLTSLDGLNQVQTQSFQPSSSSSYIHSTDNTSGIIPRYAGELFNILDRVTELKQNEGFDFSVHCKFMQIYNEKIFDLLQDRRRERPLQLRERSFSDSSSSSSSSNTTSKSSIYVQGLSEYRVHCTDDVLELVRKGLRNRAVRGTEMNAESSRSHTILQLFIQVECLDSTIITDEELSSEFEYNSNNNDEVPTPLQGLRVLRRSLVSLVDLAGSEKINTNANTFPGSSIKSNNNFDPTSTSTTPSSNTNDAYALAKTASETLRETSNINSSLHVLGMCVAALADSQNKKKDRHIHVPFRNSVLTRLLQSSLTGTGRTVLLATVQSELTARDETHNTLMFAARASSIKVADVASERVADSGLSLDEAKRQIALLRGRLEKNDKINKEKNDDNNVVGCVDCIQLKEELGELRVQCNTLKRQLQQHLISPSSGASSSSTSSSSSQERLEKGKNVLSRSQAVNNHLRSNQDDNCNNPSIFTTTTTSSSSSTKIKTKGAIELSSPGAVAARDLHQSLLSSPSLYMDSESNSNTNDNVQIENVNETVDTETQRLVREALMAELPPVQSLDLAASISSNTSGRINDRKEVEKNDESTTLQPHDFQSDSMNISRCPPSPELSRKSISSFTSDGDRETARLSASVSVEAPIVQPPSNINSSTHTSFTSSLKPDYQSAIETQSRQVPQPLDMNVNNSSVDRCSSVGNRIGKCEKMAATVVDDPSGPCTRHKLRACVLCGRSSSKDKECSPPSSTFYKSSDSPLIRSAGGWLTSAASGAASLSYSNQGQSHSNSGSSNDSKTHVNDDVDLFAQPDSALYSTSSTTTTGRDHRFALPSAMYNSHSSTSLRTSGSATSLYNTNVSSINNNSKSTLPCMEHQVNSCMLCHLKQRANTTGGDTTKNMYAKSQSSNYSHLQQQQGISSSSSIAASTSTNRFRIGVETDTGRAHTTSAVSLSAAGLGFDHHLYHQSSQPIGMDVTNIANSRVGFRDSFDLSSSSSQSAHLTMIDNPNPNTNISSFTGNHHSYGTSNSNGQISTKASMLSHLNFVEPLSTTSSVSTSTTNKNNIQSHHYSGADQYNRNFQQSYQNQQQPMISQTQLQLQPLSATTTKIQHTTLSSKDNDHGGLTKSFSDNNYMSSNDKKRTDVNISLTNKNNIITDSISFGLEPATNAITEPVAEPITTNTSTTTSTKNTASAASDEMVRLLLLQDFPEAADAALCVPEENNIPNKTNNNTNVPYLDVSTNVNIENRDHIEIPEAVTVAVPVSITKKERKKKKKKRKNRNHTKQDELISGYAPVPGEKDMDMRDNDCHVDDNSGNNQSNIYDQSIGLDLEHSQSSGVCTSLSLLDQGSTECMPNLASVCVDGDGDDRVRVSVEGETDDVPMFHHSLSPSTTYNKYNKHNIDVLSTNSNSRYRDPLSIVEEDEKQERYSNGTTSPQLTLPPLKSGVNNPNSSTKTTTKSGLKKSSKYNDMNINMKDKENSLNGGGKTKITKTKHSSSNGNGRKKNIRSLRPVT